MNSIVIIFFIAILVQSVFLFMWLVAFAGRRSTGLASTVPVSVVVCAQNEEQNLRILIPLLLQQCYPRFEVIVVEDRSNDDTIGYISEVMKSDSRLSLVRTGYTPDHVNGKKFALTLGVKAASNEWILLTDADCLPYNNQWIRSMSYSFVKEKKIVLGYSPYSKSKGLLNAVIRFECLLTGLQYMGMAFVGRPYMGVGRNLAYRKSFFLEHKGFHTHLALTGGDDDLFVNEFSSKENLTWSMGKNSVVYSHPKTSWRAFYIQKIRHLSVGKYYKISDRITLGLFYSSMFMSWLLIVPSLFYASLAYAVLAAFLYRWILFASLIYVGSRKLGTSFEAWKTPLLDFIFTLGYIIIGVATLHRKTILWKEA